MERLSSFLLLACLSFASGCAAPAASDIGPTVILIAFDGWRWDYGSKYEAPNLARLAARGVQAEGLIPPFPSKTFPSHYSVVTGLHPGRHGIVANNILDVGTGRRFSLSNRAEVQDSMWWGGEPLWLTLRREGRIAAAMFWPGSEAPVGGHWPHHWSAFDTSVPGEDRVDQVLAWLDLPAEERPALMTLYFEDVDAAGHADGPDSRAVREAVERVDGYLGRLVRGLDERGLLDRVNLVVISDHGMAETSADRLVVLDDYISLDDVDVVDINPTLGLFPRAGREEMVYRALSAAHPRLKVYRRDETPEHWHLRDHHRIPPIVGVVDEGWEILPRATVERRQTGALTTTRGMHGYDPRGQSMIGLFVAAGPAFKIGARVPAFANVHVYLALAQALDIPPAPNDAAPAIARSLLR